VNGTRDIVVVFVLFSSSSSSSSSFVVVVIFSHRAASLRLFRFEAEYVFLEIRALLFVSARFLIFNPSRTRAIN
jgi:hypothetical protein